MGLVHSFRVVMILAQKLLPPRQTRRIKLPLSDCAENRAARFGLVSAISEPALACQLGQIGKDLFDPFCRIRQAQLAHSRRVDQPAACQCRT